MNHQRQPGYILKITFTLTKNKVLILHKMITKDSTIIKELMVCLYDQIVHFLVVLYPQILCKFEQST